MKENKKILKLAESAVMIALATILSLLKLVELPYGGSITPASMLPILIIAYRYGTLWGLFTGLVHGVLQFILGSSVLSYVTGAASVAAVIILDYLLAFALIGLGGLTRKISSERTALAAGALIASVARYLCHVASGATVWAGLSVPTAGALAYSFAYNATYMIPEAIVLALAAFYVGGLLDFKSEKIGTAHSKSGKSLAPSAVSTAFLGAALIYDAVKVFPHLQNAETGDFDITGLSSVSWSCVAVVTVAAIVFGTAVYAVWRAAEKKHPKEKK